MSIAAKSQEHVEPLSPSGTHPSKGIKKARWKDGLWWTGKMKGLVGLEMSRE